MGEAEEPGELRPLVLAQRPGEQVPFSCRPLTTRDPAAFRPEDFQAIHGERPRCFISDLWQLCEGHHVLGRCYDHGARLVSEERKIFSSPFNFAPLQRDVHNGPQRDSTEMRWLLLRLARRRVLEAVQKGSYAITDVDDRFLAFAERWRQENPV